MISVKLPDGSTANFPDGTSPDVMKSAIQKKFPPKAATNPQVDNAAPAANPQVDNAAPAANPQGPLDQNFTTPSIMGLPPVQVNAGDIVSGLNALGDSASFGLAPAIMRGVQNVFAPGSGDETAAKVQAVNEAHPAGVAVGTTLSVPVDMLATSGLAGPLVAASEAVPIVNSLLRGGKLGGTVARLATTGAVMGGTNAATHGGDVLSGAALGAAIGPAAGAVGNVAGRVVEKLINPTATRAWRYLAGKFDINPDQLVEHVTQWTQRTGRPPTLQQVVSDRDAGMLAKFGQDFPAAGEVLRSGAQASDAALPAAAQDVVNATRRTLPAPPDLIQHLNPATTTEAEILNATTAGTTAAMDGIRTTGVSLSPNLATDLTSQLGTGRATRELRGRILDGTATVGDLDIARRRLDKLANGAIPNPDLQDIVSELETAIGDQVPEYATIMGQHAAAKRYASGFGHGTSGAERGAATDPGLRAALATAEGENGFRAGSLSRTAATAGGSPSVAAGVLGDISRPGTAQTAFQSVAGPAAAPAAEAATALRTAGERARASAPGALRPQAETSAAAANIATGLAESPIAPISAVRNVSRGIYQFMSGTRLSKEVQREVANALVSPNPAIRDFAIEHLRRAGQSDARIRLITGLVAANAARSATSYQGAQ